MRKVRSAFLLLLMVLSASAQGQLWKQYVDSASFYKEEKNIDKAINFFILAKKNLPIDSFQTNTHAAIVGNIGWLFEQTNTLDSAEIFYQEFKDIVEKINGKQSADYAESCFNLCLLYFKEKKIEEAEQMALETKQIREVILGRTHPDHLNMYNVLVSIYAKKNQYDKAISTVVESLEIQREIGKKNLGFVQSNFNLAMLYVETEQDDKAESILKEVLHDIELIDTAGMVKQLNTRIHSIYIISNSNLGRIMGQSGRLKLAESIFLESKEINGSEGIENPDYASSCNNLSIVYTDMGDFERAAAYCKEAKRIREKVLPAGHPEHSNTSNNLARIYMLQGEFEKAEELYLAGIANDIINHKEDTRNHMMALNNLGTLYNSMGLYDKSKEYHLKAKAKREKLFGREDRDYAQSCKNLGDIYTNKGMYEEAEEYYIEAKEIREKKLGRLHNDYASSLNHLGILYSLKGDYKKAEAFLLEAMELREQIPGIGNQHPDYAQCKSDLAGVYYQSGNYTKAEKYYSEALAIYKIAFGEQHPHFVKNCYYLANVYWARNEDEKAKKFYEKGADLLKYQTEKIFKFTNESEQQAYISTATNLQNFFFSFSANQTPTTSKGFLYDQFLLNRNLILGSSRQLRQTIYHTTDTTTKKLYDLWIRKREQLTFWLTEPIQKNPVFVKELTTEADSLEKVLNKKSQLFKTQQESKEINRNQIHHYLKSNEAAIEFQSFQYYNGHRWTDSTYYIALVLRKDKPEPEMIKLFDEKELNDLLKIYKGTSGEQAQINYLYKKKDNNNKTLYDLIWKPLEEKLEGINTVYFAPSGSLFKIAFAALPINEKQALSDKVKLVQLNTTASVVDQVAVTITASDKIILYGGVQYDMDSTAMKLVARQSSENDVVSRSLPEDLTRDGVPEFRYLAGTSKEVNGISKLAEQNKFSISVHEGQYATEESFKSMNGKNSPAVIHIATHGIFFPDPKKFKKNDRAGGYEVFRQSDNPLIRSGLALAGANNAWKGKPVNGVEDGILTSYEISNMYLPKTKLAILSACETGLGDIQGSEGVYGLQRAFKIAGVENLVMSLWKVPDQETSEFMQVFYRNLFYKHNIQDAFYSTQSAMRNKYRNDPYKWAAWVLIR
ncbi:MAG TPA: CHAT domain-containing protein [Chitinophagaceae bacterium]|nr:CHAT domain-containing protein [Chitinophagaceae bacterium]